MKRISDADHEDFCHCCGERDSFRHLRCTNCGASIKEYRGEPDSASATKGTL